MNYTLAVTAMDCSVCHPEMHELCKCEAVCNTCRVTNATARVELRQALSRGTMNARCPRAAQTAGGLARTLNRRGGRV